MVPPPKPTMVKEMFVFVCGDQTSVIDGYCTGDVKREILKALKSAAYRINEKHKKRQSAAYFVKGNLLCYKRRSKKENQDEEQQEEEELLGRNSDYISESKLENVEVDIFAEGGTDRIRVTLTLHSDGEDCFNEKWFQKSVKMFQRTQVLCYSGVFW